MKDQGGVWITDGGGHEKTLGLLEALTAGHLSFAAMVDNEGKWPTRWSSVEESLGDLLIQWDEGCLEQNVIPLFEDESLSSLIEDPVGEWTGTRLRSLAVRLGTEEKEFEHIKKTAGDNLIQVITEAAAGKVPDEFADGEKSKKKEFRGHASAWFKSKRGGRELAEKVFNLGVWPKLKPKVLPFLNAVRSEIGRESIEELPQ